MNTTSQRTEELNQLTQAQNVLMLRLKEEIESKEEMTNRLRNSEEEMEEHVANVERLEKLLKDKENESLLLKEKLLEERNVQTQHEIEELLKEKEELQNRVENLKSKSEEMEKVYEREKQQLHERIIELQNKMKNSESELRLHLSEDSYTGVSVVQDEALPEEKPATPQVEELKAKIDSLQQDFQIKEKEFIELNEEQENMSNEILSLKENKVDLENQLRKSNNEFVNIKQTYEQEIERLRSLQVQGKHEIHGNEELLVENQSLKKEVGTLKASLKTLTNDMQNVCKEKDDLQTSFQEAEIVWEEEKNNLQQQLYDSCLEASSFKVRKRT